MVEERSVEPTSERELTLTRVFAVPARILFLAWSRPEHLMKWFGPGPYPLTFCEMDFRVGGKYRFAMTGPDGRQGPFFGGEYLVIDQDRTISYTNAFEQAGTETMIVTVRFTETAGKTTLVHHALRLGGDEASDHEAGLRGRSRHGSRSTRTGRPRDGVTVKTTRSKDGTVIAYEELGFGPRLVLVDVDGLADKLGAINVPTLALAGGKSPPWMHHASKKIAETVTSGAFRVVPGQDHNVSAKAMAPVITEFMLAP